MEVVLKPAVSCYSLAVAKYQMSFILKNTHFLHYYIFSNLILIYFNAVAFDNHHYHTIRGENNKKLEKVNHLFPGSRYLSMKLLVDRDGQVRM